MGNEELLQLVSSAGFEKTAVIPVDKLVFNEGFRVYCEMNVCGNYNSNYACPPSCGTPVEMKEAALSYHRAIVFQSIAKVADGMEEEEVKHAKKAHLDKTWKAIKQLDSVGITGHPIMAGPCSLCSDCGKKEDTPCPHPVEVYSCLSAYCIDANEMADECEMQYWCGDNKVALFSLYLI